MVSQRRPYGALDRARLHAASTLVLAALVLGWSCTPPPPATPVEIDLQQWAWLDETDTLLLVTSVEEAEPYRTHGRLELSWVDTDGREVFRALYNPSHWTSTVPPEVFGVVDLDSGSVESAGGEGQWEVTAAGFSLRPDSASVRRDGRLLVNWAIRPAESPTGPFEVRARALPPRADSARWHALGRLELVDGAWRVVEAAVREAAHDVQLPTPFGTMLEEGDPTSALRALVILWDEGADPRTIKAVRTRALREIGEAGAFAAGDDSYPLADIRMVYEWMLMRPDVLRFRLPVEGDLSPERLLYLAVAVGEEHAAPARNGGTHVLPEIDVSAAVGSADPWVVSAALFLARKLNSEVDVADLLARWQGPKPWDQTCTEQALLYLASQPGADLAQGPAREAGLPPEVAGLAEADPDGVEIQPWLFVLSAEWDPDLALLDPGQGLALEVRDSTMDVISERPVSSEAATVNVSATRDNYYSLRYLDGSMHGESRFIQGASGTFVRMAVRVQGGV